jgi:alcohol dehydrogenase class IV
MAAQSAVRLIVDNLPGAYQQPLTMTYRDNMMMASLMAGLAFSNASLGLVHAMAHSLGGALGLAHGECNAMLLEQVVRHNYAAASSKYDQLAEAMGLVLGQHDEASRANALADRVAALRRQLAINERLRDMGVALDDLPRLAGYAFNDPCLATNPRETTREDIVAVYRTIYD